MHFFKLSKNIWNVFVVNLNILCFKGLKLFCFSFKQFKTILSFIWTRLKWMIPYFIGYLWCLIFIQSMIFFVIVSLNNNIFRGIVSIIMTKSISCSTTFKGSTAQVLIFYWLPPLIVKIDAVAFEVNMTNYSQGTTEKHFQQQLTVPPHEQTLSRKTYMEEIYLTFLLRRNMLSINVILIDIYIKHY